MSRQAVLLSFGKYPSSHAHWKLESRQAAWASALTKIWWLVLLVSQGCFCFCHGEVLRPLVSKPHACVQWCYQEAKKRTLPRYLLIRIWYDTFNVCHNINCTQEKHSLHSRWNLISTSTEFTWPRRQTLTNRCDVKYIFSRSHNLLQQFIRPQSFPNYTDRVAALWWVPYV